MFVILFSGDLFQNWFQIVHTCLNLPYKWDYPFDQTFSRYRVSCVLWRSTEVNSFFYCSLKADRYSIMWQKLMPDCQDGVSGESYNLAISVKQIHHVQVEQYFSTICRINHIVPLNFFSTSVCFTNCLESIVKEEKSEKFEAYELVVFILFYF